jgi:hypothetical protein
MIGVQKYPKKILTRQEWEALEAANVVLIDLCFSALEELHEDPASFVQSELAGWLPPASLLKWTVGTVRMFIASLASVGLKMRLRGFHAPGSTAEELALYAMTRQALTILELEGANVAASDAHFREWSDHAFEDTDHELLFDLQFDGIEDSPVAATARFANLRFDQWFVPFPPPRAVTPYADSGDTTERG